MPNFKIRVYLKIKHYCQLDNFFLDVYSVIQYHECIIVILTDVVFVTFSPSTSVRRNHLSHKYFLDFDTPSHIENEDIIKNIDIKIY